MRKKLAFIAATVIVAGGGAIAAIGSIAGSSSAAPVATIKVIEHAATDKVIDIGKAGDSSGDVLTFHNKVYDSTDTTQAGTDQGMCVRESPKQGSWECWWTTSLAGGQITVEGPFYDAKDSTDAVTGGTGTYSTATGSMDLHCYVGDDGVGRCDFTFNLS